MGTCVPVGGLVEFYFGLTQMQGIGGDSHNIYAHTCACVTDFQTDSDRCTRAQAHTIIMKRQSINQYGLISCVDGHPDMSKWFLRAHLKLHTEIPTIG